MTLYKIFADTFCITTGQTVARIVKVTHDKDLAQDFAANYCDRFGNRKKAWVK